MKKIPL